LAGIHVEIPNADPASTYKKENKTVTLDAETIFDASANDLYLTKLIARTNAALGGDLSELLSTPIRPKAGTTVYLRHIGTIENGTDLVTAYAHVNGKRTVYIPVTKRADAVFAVI
jgi:multidrug efflux pump subunit AcrB